MDSTTGISLAFPSYDQLLTDYDAERRALWCYFDAHPRPTFNLDLLADIHDVQRRLCAQLHTPVVTDPDAGPIQYIIQASATPGVFNLGGDLELFAQLIEHRDRAGLLDYGQRCVDAVYQNAIHYGVPGVTTIALVQGLALGGGFESALSSNVLIAERSARFGFPEILFNLFPGMGAYSFLERKVGRRLTEELLSSGKIYSADDMLALGVIDLVVERGAGEAEIAALAKRQSRSRNGLSAIAAARRRVNGVTYEELMDVVRLWVEAAMRLTGRDLKLMQRLVSRQNDIRPSASVH